MHKYQALEHNPKTNRFEESRQMLRAFALLTDQWGLTRKKAYELLGLTSLHHMSRWRNSDDISLTSLQIERLSYLLSINQRLKQLFHDKESIQQWLHTINHEAIFDSKTPLNKIMQANKKDLQRLSHWIITSLTCH